MPGALNGAYQLRLEDQIGSIKVGKKADLVFLQKDLFKVPTCEIHATPIMQTMMDGKVTYTAKQHLTRGTWEGAPSAQVPGSGPGRP